MSTIPLIKQDDNTNRDIDENDIEDTRESILLSHIKEDNLADQQDIMLLGQMCWDNSLWTTIVPLPKQQSCTDTVIACPPFWILDIQQGQ